MGSVSLPAYRDGDLGTGKIIASLSLGFPTRRPQDKDFKCKYILWEMIPGSTLRGLRE